MVKNNRAAAKKSPTGAAPGAKKSPRPGSAGKSPKGPGPLNTSKGQFTFTMVTDGCYIEHKVCAASLLTIHSFGAAFSKPLRCTFPCA